jgi:hypothetical protein
MAGVMLAADSVVPVPTAGQSDTSPITGGVLKVLAMLFSPLYWAHRGCRSEGQGVPDFWQNLGDYDPALWIPYAALAAQIAAATIIAILALRWQERASRGRNRAIR